MDTIPLTLKSASLIRQALHKLGHAEHDVADASGIDRDDLHRKLSGEVPFTVDDLHRIAAALELRSSALICDQPGGDGQDDENNV